jgi:hypothetical protein
MKYYVKCKNCDNELYEGYEAVEYDGMCFCDYDCLDSYILDTVHEESSSVTIEPPDPPREGE